MARSRSVGVFAAVAFLLSPPPHSAVNFDFHPETAAFFFVFLGAFFLAEGRAGLAAASVLPTLLFKEDMALVVLAFAVLTATRGNRKAAARLAAFSLAWLTIVTLVVMPLLRGGGGDLVSCYAYLIEGSSWGSFVPNLATRAASHLVRETLPGVVALLTSTAFLPLISPVSLLLSLPSMLINGLAGHDEQAHLGLHYSVPTLVLMWLGVLLTLEKLASRRILLPLAASALLSACAMGFLTSSPFAPGSKEQHLSSAHRSALAAAISHVPPGASVAAQSAVLPHLSARRKVYEFPNGRRADLVVVDPGLPWSLQSDHWGYSSRIARLPDTGYKLVFDSEGVQVCQRRQ